MAHVSWDHNPPTTWTAMVDGQAICSVKRKDIGGWTAAWEDERLWPAAGQSVKAHLIDLERRGLVARSEETWTNAN